MALDTNSSYASIVNLLRESPYHHSIRIFGLTASIISTILEEPKELDNKIRNLEYALDSFGGLLLPSRVYSLVKEYIF